VLLLVVLPLLLWEPMSMSCAAADGWCWGSLSAAAGTAADAAAEYLLAKQQNLWLKLQHNCVHHHQLQQWGQWVPLQQL
jgi:hypothetical protein